MKNIVLLMTFSGSLFFMVYLLISWCSRKSLKTGVRLLLLKVTLFLYLVPFQLFKYLLPDWLWRNNWSKMDIYRLTENYVIHSHNDYIADMDVIFSWVWCIISSVVAAIFIVLHLVRYFHMKRILRECTMDVESVWQREKLESVQKEMRLRRNIRFVFSECFTSPFTFGYFSPVIILPLSMKEGNEEQWDFVVRHELNHIKSNHMIVKFLALTANLIHFFNPLAYLLRREIYSMCEIDCDSKTIENYDTERRKRYGEHIVDTASHSKGFYPVASMGLLGHKLKKGEIQRRILEMNQSKTKKRIVSVVATVAAVLVGSVSVFAYEPAIEIENDNITNTNVDLFVYSEDANVPELELNTGDTFTDKDGNVYNTSGVERAICFHSFADVIVGDHTLHSDGSCTIKYYDAQRCTKCGYIKVGAYTGATTTYEKCPH